MAAQLTAVQAAAKHFQQYMEVRLVGKVAFDACNPGVELTLYYSPWGGVEVTYFWVDPVDRGKGLGSLVMRTLCAWADAEREIVRLWAKPYEKRGMPGVDAFTLAAWYARHFGFMPTRAGVWEDQLKIRMLRYPG